MLFEPAHPRLPRVLGHDQLQRRVVEGRSLGTQAVPPKLLGEEMPPADLHLLGLRVAAHLQDLESVAKREAHVAQVVGGGDEEHLR